MIILDSLSRLEEPEKRMSKFIKHLIYPFILIIMSSTVNHTLAGKSTGVSNKAFTSGTTYTWYDGDRVKKIWLNPRLIAEFDPKPANHDQSKNLAASATPVKTKQRSIRLWRLKTAVTSKSYIAQLKQSVPSGKISPVLHDGASESARKRALPGNIIVHLDPSWDSQQVKTWFRQQALEVVKPLNIGPNIFVIKTGAGLEALEKANEIYLSGKVVAAYPDWWQEVHKK